MEPQSGVRTWQWVVTVVVIIVLIVIGVLVFGGKGSQAPATTSESPSPSTSATAVNRITMTDQYPGNVVYLNSVQLDKPGYVAIHKDNNGQPGDIIGYTHFDAGINPGKVTLKEPMIDGKVYYAMLHSDNGDGTFDPTSDAPLMDASGNVIMNTFRATTSAGAGLKG